MRPQQYLALATDYDDTIAHDGRVDASTVETLQRARQAGLRLVLVTGRMLEDLMSVFPETRIFDRLVVENGALIFDPARGESRALAPPPPPLLLRALADEGIPVSLGRSIVAMPVSYHAAVSRAIRDLRLDWHLIFNKGSLMVLPSGVTKASGLSSALKQLDVPAARTIAMGDAENDLPLLGACGLAVAVGNALPAVKSLAHVVTAASRGEGVCEFVNRLLEGGA